VTVSRKTAFTDFVALMRTLQTAPLRFAQGPLHLQKDHSSDGRAVSLTIARTGNWRRHFERQAIPSGLLVTFPLPLSETVRRGRRVDACPIGEPATANEAATTSAATANHLKEAERVTIPAPLTRLALHTVALQALVGSAL
jgi:hypothetical protein